MSRERIGIFRGVFDPVHKGHLSSIESSFAPLELSKILVIVKFIGEKDPVASLRQRITMLELQIRESEFPIEVIQQNVQGHIAELLELNRLNTGPVINICGSDKIIQEMNMYGKPGDTFGVINRSEFELNKQASAVAKRKNINLVEVKTTFTTSSTYIRSIISNNDQTYGFELDKEVSRFIERNSLYRISEDKTKSMRFHSAWLQFILKLEPHFPRLNLREIEMSEFNPVQSELAWNEKYINRVIKVRKLKGDDISEFVAIANKLTK